MKKYFEVAAKCGHVGREYYYEGHFFVATSSASDAAQVIRKVPRVKHNHKDAILWVREISHETYVIGCIEKEKNPYFSARNSKEQAAMWEQIEHGVHLETEKQMAYRDKHSKGKKRESDGSQSKYGYRKYYKYMKNRLKYDNVNYDYDEVA